VRGYPLENRSYQSDDIDYKFIGKQRDAETGYDYFGARYYDARIANWGSVDPLFEKHIGWNPYNYVLRNPMALIDPDGRQVLVIFGGFGAKSEGEEIKNYSENSSVGSDILTAKLNNYLSSNKETFPNAEIKEFYSSFSGSEVADAKEFIENHMINYPDDKIIIYGYSMGGVRANDLSRNLEWEYDVQLEITVDAYCPPSSLISRGLTIPTNVKRNDNYYIEDITSVTLAHGGENKSESKQTLVRNTVINGETHKSISKYTNEWVFGSIKKELQENK